MAIIDAIKFNGLAQGDWLIYKYYRDDITTGAPLIVGEGQNAVFVHNGKIADVFTPGTYTLATENLPVLRSLINLPFGDQTPFSAEVYYVNTTTKMDLLWGLPDPIQIIDPKYGIRLRVRSFGQTGLKVVDSGKLLCEVIGSLNGNAVVRYDKLMDFFKGILVSRVKSILAQLIIDDKISALEISSKLEILSDKTKEGVNQEFSKYGIELVNFLVKSISVPEEDLTKLTKILEEKATFDLVGDQHYAMKRSFDIYETAANSNGGVAGSMMAGGFGVGAGMQMIQNIPQMGAGAQTAQKQKCPQCGNSLTENAKFCSNCGFNVLPKKCSCGAEIKPGMKFCSECGQKVE